MHLFSVAVYQITTNLSILEQYPFLCHLLSVSESAVWAPVIKILYSGCTWLQPNYQQVLWFYVSKAWELPSKVIYIVGRIRSLAYVEFTMASIFFNVSRRKFLWISFFLRAPTWLSMAHLDNFSFINLQSTNLRS